jgi:hypothetical protein
LGVGIHLKVNIERRSVDCWIDRQKRDRQMDREDQAQAMANQYKYKRKRLRDDKSKYPKFEKKCIKPIKKYMEIERESGWIE